MDTMSEYLRGKAARAAGAWSRVFDWERAAKIIVEKGARTADAGLSEDWGCTGFAQEPHSAQKVGRLHKNP